MDYHKKEIDLGPTFAKLTDQEIQELQKNADKYAKSYQNVLEGMNMELVLGFYRSQQVQLDIMRDIYEKDPNRPLDLARLTYAFNILTDLINDKCYSRTKDDQVDDIEESSSVRGDDETMLVMEVEDNGNEKGNISSENDEELDPLSLQIT